MPSDVLLVELRGRVLYLTMNRPDKLNALSRDLMDALVEALRPAAENPEVGCVVLTGAGRGFCSGGDIGIMGDRRDGEAAPARKQSIGEHAAWLRHVMEAPRLLHEMHKVTIAAVNGAAAGAGLSLAMACDLRIAVDTARFGTAFARIGFSGDYGGTWSLTRLVGSAKARELYFLPDMIDAREALRIGLVNRVASPESFKDEVEKIANRIGSGPTVAYRFMKENLNLAVTHEFSELLDRESWGQTLTGRTEDHKEAVKAFVEKREPKFQGR